MVLFISHVKGYGFSSYEVDRHIKVTPGLLSGFVVPLRGSECLHGRPRIKNFRPTIQQWITKNANTGEDPGLGGQNTPSDSLMVPTVYCY